jgi:hypothetical protein
LEHVGRRLGLLAAGNRVNEEQVLYQCACIQTCGRAYQSIFVTHGGKRTYEMSSF